MLKKISGYTTRFLFYLRNHFLSLIFKSSVFLTLLTLIYLVSVLKQANSMQKSQQIEVQNIAKSQKLMLTIPTKIEFPPSTTENPTTMDNFISKVRIDVGSHPFFPIKELTTSPMFWIDTTSSLPIQEETVHSVGFMNQQYPVQDITTARIMSIEEPSSLPPFEETTTAMEPTEHPFFLYGDQSNHPMVSFETTPSLLTGEEKISSPIDSIERESLLATHYQPSPALEFNELLPTIPMEETTPLFETLPFFPIHEQTTSMVEEVPFIPVQEPTTPIIDTLPFFPIQEQTTPMVEALPIISVQEQTTPMEEALSFFPIQEQTTPEIVAPPFFSIQEQTTPMEEALPFAPIQEQTTPLLEANDVYSLLTISSQEAVNTDTIETTSSLPSQDQTTSSSTCEYQNTEASSEQEEPTKTTEAPTLDSVAPFKRSLTLNELRLFGNSMDTVPETTTSTPLQTDEVENYENTDDSTTESTTTSNSESNEITSTEPSITDLPETSDLFGDIPDADEPDSEPDSILPTDRSSGPFIDNRPLDSLFQDEDHEFNAVEEPILENETNDDDDEEKRQSAEVFNVDTMISDSTEERLHPLNTHPFDLQHNLFNLFNLDHFPAMSNIKPIRWSNSDNAPVPMAFSSPPGRQVNTIFPIADSDDEVNASSGLLQRLNRYHQLDSLLNMRIKDSVSLLERLFGNFLT